VVAAGPEEIRGPKQLYELKVEFLGGLPNDGGTVPDDALQNKDGALATQSNGGGEGWYYRRQWKGGETSGIVAK